MARDFSVEACMNVLAQRLRLIDIGLAYSAVGEQRIFFAVYGGATNWIEE